MVKKIILVLCLFVFAFSLQACKKEQDNSELLKELPDMIKEGRILLDYVYGDGLPYDANGSEPYRKGYTAVLDGSRFKSIAEFEAALNEVFTENTVLTLNRTAFERIYSDGATYLPRYIEDENGTLYINKENDIDIKRREPNLDSLKITNSNEYMVEVELTMLNSDDGSSTKDKFVMRKEDGKWKFDSAAIL